MCNSFTRARLPDLYLAQDTEIDGHPEEIAASNETLRPLANQERLPALRPPKEGAEYSGPCSLAADLLSVQHPGNRHHREDKVYRRVVGQIIDPHHHQSGNMQDDSRDRVCRRHPRGGQNNPEGQLED